MLSNTDHLFYQPETGPNSDWPDVSAILETLEVQNPELMDTQAKQLVENIMKFGGAALSTVTESEVLAKPIKFIS